MLATVSTPQHLFFKLARLVFTNKLPNGYFMGDDYLNPLSPIWGGYWCTSLPLTFKQALRALPFLLFVGFVGYPLDSGGMFELFELSSTLSTL
jgi:hypothetical protein